ncbi:hypothetical protein TNCV_1615321 [Trichonephila clavipes]|nr:hypothetical protein TNCV_1615321 [Trichonephila clavipes]
MMIVVEDECRIDQCSEQMLPQSIQFLHSVTKISDEIIITKRNAGHINHVTRQTSPPGGAVAYRLLHSSINCQVANLTLLPTFRYVSIESPL